MSKEKQIEEIKEEICSCDVTIDRCECCAVCVRIATALYNAGYRKQSEGKWIIKRDEYDNEYMMCSHCKEEFYPVDADTVDITPNFCPNCGSKMKGGAE